LGHRDAPHPAGPERWWRGFGVDQYGRAARAHGSPVPLRAGTSELGGARASSCLVEAVAGPHRVERGRLLQVAHDWKDFLGEELKAIADLLEAHRADLR